MRSRIFGNKYQYGPVLEKESQVFKKDIYKRIGVRKLFLDKKIMDLGCGFGTDSIILAKFAKSVTGVDILKYEEWKHFKSKKIKFLQGDSTRLPFKDNSFDGVYLKDLLHHIKTVGKTLDEIKRITKPGGSIVILEGNRYNPLFFLYVTKVRGHDHFTQKEFKRIINKRFPDFKHISIEAYPPFCFRMNVYKYVLSFQRQISRVKFLKPFFTYNIAIIKNVK